jgi:hypothetical protein
MIAVFAVSSCSEEFFNIRPVGAVDEGALLTEQGIDWMITGMYSTLYAGPPNNTIMNLIWGDNLAGNCNKGSQLSDQPNWTAIETYVITSDNGYFSSKWSHHYNGVFRANVVLDMLEKMSDELADKAGEEGDYITEAEAQARFFRAMWHFENVKLFGAAIPYVGLEDYQSSVNPQVSNVDDAGNYVYIWDKIMEDFQFAYDNLPDTWSKDQGRVNKWAALAYLAKVQMYYASPYNGANGTNPSTANWNTVKSTIETLMANGVDNKGQAFTLADTYEELFTAGESDWTGESVFDVQTTLSGTQTNTNQTWSSVWNNLTNKLTASGWGFIAPSTDLAYSYYVDANGLPYLDRGYEDLYATEMQTISGNVVTTDLTTFTDPRIDVNLGRFNVPYWDWGTFTTIDGIIREVGNGGLFYGKKHIMKKSDYGTYTVTKQRGSAKNPHVIRWADVLLWYAEALIETGTTGVDGDARYYVNLVRARAGNDYVRATGGTSYVMEDLANGGAGDGSDAAANYRIGLWPASQFSTPEGAMKALRAERRAELAMEGHLWYDLARWGIVVEEVNDYLAFEQGYLSRFANKAYGSTWFTMPLPDAQITTMEGLLVQNVNWK